MAQLKLSNAAGAHERPTAEGVERRTMIDSKGITHKPGTKSILDLRNLYERNHLNLEPGFQRDSVWKPRDRAFLIDTILRNYPLPAIFL